MEVDVSSKSLDARIGRDGANCVFWQLERIAELAEFCRCHKVHLVAMGSHWGYEKKPFALLWAAGIQVAVVNPRAVRSFAQGMGLLEKTDRIDTSVIAWYADTKGCVAVARLRLQQQQLKAMVTRLRQLTELRTAQHNQRHTGDRQGGAEVLSQVAGSCAEADTRSGSGHPAGLIDADAVWQKLDQSFRSIKGLPTVRWPG